MREIKFRAWEIGFNRMLYQNMDGNGKKDERWGTEWAIFETCLRAVQKEYVLMQFISLHDRNGKEIYEGDVVECRCGLPSCIKRNPNPIELWDGFWLKGTEKNLEVVGNIYENPELLAKEAA